MASSLPTELELITFNYIRNHYEKKYKQNVPMALKYLTSKYSNMIIGCKLLTIKEDLNFFKLLSTKLSSIRKFNLLFRASDHNYSAAKFHEHCDDKGGTITIIKSNFGNIFGGYTSKSWKKLDTVWFKKDENAFLFLIKCDDKSLQYKCPLLLELKQKYVEYAILCTNHGPTFGGGFDISINDNCNNKLHNKSNRFNTNFSCQSSYDAPKVTICGGNTTDPDYPQKYLFQVIDYEVFQIV